MGRKRKCVIVLGRRGSEEKGGDDERRGLLMISRGMKTMEPSTTSDQTNLKTNSAKKKKPKPTKHKENRIRLTVTEVEEKKVLKKKLRVSGGERNSKGAKRSPIVGCWPGSDGLTQKLMILRNKFKAVGKRLSAGELGPRSPSGAYLILKRNIDQTLERLNFGNETRIWADSRIPSWEEEDEPYDSEAGNFLRLDEITIEDKTLIDTLDNVPLDPTYFNIFPESFQLVDPKDKGKPENIAHEIRKKRKPLL